MASVHVSGLVASIVSAFATGTEILGRMGAQRSSKKGRQKPDRLSQEEECQLRNSLQHRPKEILAEYDRKVAELGDRFAVGDSAAQTTLNHTLLSLNTGLIQILSHCLSNLAQTQPICSQSLLDLSETAAADSVRALDQLHARLYSTTRGGALDPAGLSYLRASRQGSGDPKSAVIPKTRPDLQLHSKSCTHIDRKRLKPDPLVRGAWVRSKSSTSASATSSSCASSTVKLPQMKMASATTPPVLHEKDTSKPSHRRHIKSTPTTSSPFSSRKHSKPSSRPGRDGMPLPSDHSLPSYPANLNRKVTQPPNRQPSMLIVSPEALVGSSTPAFQPQYCNKKPPSSPSPPQLQKAPFNHSTDPTRKKVPDYLPAAAEEKTSLGPRPQHRAPSTATLRSFMTASTKIGEIPEDKWSRHQRRQEPDEQQQQQQMTSQYTIATNWEDQAPTPPTMTKTARKRGWGMMKFWRGRGRNNDEMDMIY